MSHLTFLALNLHLARMPLCMLLKRVAVVVVLFAALVNGLTAPLAHGHVLVPPPAHGVPSEDTAPTLVNAELAQADECEGAHKDPKAAPDHGDRSHEKAPGKMQLICSGGGSCCAAVAIADLPVMANTGRIGTFVGLPLSFTGLTPPVGERPPLSLHV